MRSVLDSTVFRLLPKPWPFCLVVAGAVLGACRASAHHSYADFNQDASMVLEGTITAVHWGNPHILLTVNDGQQDMRIEWITTTGASKTGVEPSQFTAGDHIIVTGSPHRNPQQRIMTLIKTLQMPTKQWQWVSPSSRNQ